MPHHTGDDRTIAHVKRWMPLSSLVSCVLLMVLIAAGCSSKKDGDSKRKQQPTTDKPSPHAKPLTLPLADATPTLSAAVAAKTAGTHWSVGARSTAIADGVAVIKKHECTRCHAIDGLRTSADKKTRRARDCVSCHVFIKSLKPEQKLYKRIAKRNGKDILDKYINNIVHLVSVPQLTGIARRIRPAWTATYLQAPFDLRPVMAESMYRNTLTKVEAKKVARYLAAIADVPDPFAATALEAAKAAKAAKAPGAKRIEQGKKTFLAKGCHVCHTFGNVNFGIEAKTLIATKAMTRLAPNLRFAKDRLTRDVLVRWIINPKSVQANATMPSFGVNQADAELIRDYLLYGDPKLQPAPTADARATLMKLPPAADHPVDWAEVKEKVLGVVCVHCHMNDYEKDTGPGNTGGMGFKGLGLAFRTYRRIVWGAADTKTGERYSVLVPRKGETLPRLLQVLLLRKVENLRDLHQPLADHKLTGFADGVLGMPMGLAALSDTQIGIVRAWIEQGCKGRKDVSGRPGFDDGFLVADGPIKKNQGCELRKPEMPLPPWTIEVYKQKQRAKSGANNKKDK